MGAALLRLSPLEAASVVVEVMLAPCRRSCESAGSRCRTCSSASRAAISNDPCGITTFSAMGENARADAQQLNAGPVSVLQILLQLVFFDHDCSKHAQLSPLCPPAPQPCRCQLDPLAVLHHCRAAEGGRRKSQDSHEAVGWRRQHEDNGRRQRPPTLLRGRDRHHLAKDR